MSPCQTAPSCEPRPRTSVWNRKDGPSPDSVVDTLLGRLEEQANNMAVSQPEKSKRLKEVVGFFAGAGREVLVNVISSGIKQMTGLP